MALRLELARKEVKDDPNRTAELAAYFTHAKLQVSKKNMAPETFCEGKCK